MKLSKRIREANPNYVGSYSKSEIEKVAEVFDMVSNLNSAIKKAGYNKPDSKLKSVSRKGYQHLFIEEL